MPIPIRIALLGAITIVSGVAAPTPAAAQSLVSLGVAAGASVPKSGLGRRTSTGYHAMVTLSVHAPMTPLSFRVEGMFNELDYNSDLGSGGGAPFRAQEKSARILAATANGILTSSGLLRPYIIGGVGIYRTTEAVPLLGGTQSTNDVGWNLGGGLRFDLTGFGAYAEARYHWIGDPGLRMLPVTFGLTF